MNNYEINQHLQSPSFPVYPGGMERWRCPSSKKYLAPLYCVHHDPGDPWDKQKLSLTEYVNRVQVSRAPFPDQRFDIQALVAEGETVVMTWLWRATHQGDIPGFPATGKTITMSGSTAYFFEQGLIEGHWQIADRLGVLMQLRHTKEAS